MASSSAETPSAPPESAEPAESTKPAQPTESESKATALRQRIQSLTSETEYSEMNNILKEMAAIFAGSVYVHPRILVFKDAAMRDHSEFAGKEECDTYREFIISGNQPDINVKIGLFNTHRKTRLQPTPPGMSTAEGVAQAEADWLHGHVWVAALVRPAKGKGRIPLVSDNEPNPHGHALETLRRNAMLGAQIGLLKELEKKGTPPSQVLYNLDDSRQDGKQRCLLHALEWMLKMAGKGNRGWDGPEDKRGEGFRPLPK